MLTVDFIPKEMNIFYRSLRVGKDGKTFWMYKFRTLKDGSDKETHFANNQYYTKWGHTLRKYKIDELPQLWNVLKGDMAIVGPRPEEPSSMAVIPEYIKKQVLSVKPGLTDLASLYFYDEEYILQQIKEPLKSYWTQIKPIKLLLQVFYVNNKCLLLDIAILWITLKKILLRK